jgi:NAD(P)-dependent dehydrogenase (short-subunit alcohol dehydrogenase family)
MKSIQELMSLDNRVALVTGGGGHIGSAICAALAELGADIAVLDMDRESCNKAVEEIGRDYGVGALPLVVDLADELAVRAAPQVVLDNLGRLDILVNCAALVGTSQLEGWVAPFLEQNVDTWRLAQEINLTAPFVLIQACAEALADSGRGSIVNISSIYGMVGPKTGLYEGNSLGVPAAYASSKAGLGQLTRWLSTVLAPAVRVNTITVGGVWRNQPESFHQRYLDHTPLGRMAAEEDLKGAAAYLASDLSAYVTGHNLVVDGGWTAW